MFSPWLVTWLSRSGMAIDRLEAIRLPLHHFCERPVVSSPYVRALPLIWVCGGAAPTFARRNDQKMQWLVHHDAAHALSRARTGDETVPTVP